MSVLLLPALAAGSSGQGALYVDDVFSTYLRTGTGADTTVTTGIDMAKGYMLWSKGRSGVTEHAVYDSARGLTLDLVTNSTGAQTTQATGLKAVSSTGHTIGSLTKMNASGATYVDLVFRKTQKFFDVVTYTGNGVAGRQIPHGLGVQAGFVTVKATSTTGDWNSYHRSATGDLKLNLTDAQTASRAIITAADANSFTVSGAANTNGVSYVAYLWAHDPSADGIIQCGSFTTDASGNATVQLGWEPQFLILKASSTTYRWEIQDSMRGMAATDGASNNNPFLRAEVSNAEAKDGYAINTIKPQAAGFTYTRNDAGLANTTFIYLAIRRPNKPPTSGTQVYSSSTASGVVNAGFPVDLHIGATRTGAASNHAIHARLTGGTRELVTSATAAEATITDIGFDSMTGLKASLPSGMVNHFFRRAHGFFDVVCYTGNSNVVPGGDRSVPHNLSAVPELVIIKLRSNTGAWVANHSYDYSKYLILNQPQGTDGIGQGVSFLPFGIHTNSTFGVRNANGETLNALGVTYVAYLFATLAGISKVGSYTGNGSSQTIDCGFSAGARFFLVKATSTTGSWWVYDSARGIVSAADPALQLNSTAAEITSADAVDPTSVGIIVNQEATCSINATGVSYIFLAIA